MSSPALAGVLAQAVGRDVRTPLHSVLGFLELLSMSPLDGDQRRLLEQVTLGAETLVAATDRVVVLLSTLGGRQHQPVHLRQLLQEAVASAQGASERQVRLSLDGGLPDEVGTDAAAVRQIVVELVDNALRHGSAPVSVTAAPTVPRPDRPYGGVRIAVRDGGLGLPPALAQALRGGQPPTGHTPGVGLLITQQLAATLGATLTCTRAEVALHLPVPGEQAAPGGPAPAPAARRPVALRVLLAEDNAVNRLLTERQLRHLGHDLTCVPRGALALQALQDGVYDVLLLDRHLPDLDGLEVARRLRAAEPPGRRLPILAVTADTSPGSRRDCLAAGMDGYLSKPLDLHSLAAALSPYLADTPAQQPAALDEAALDRLLATCDGDAELVQHVLSTYLEELPARRLRISAAARRGDGPALHAAAESLRGSSAAIGAFALAAHCEQLAATATTDPATTAAVLPALLEHCERTQRALLALPRQRPAGA